MVAYEGDAQDENFEYLGLQLCECNLEVRVCVCVFVCGVCGVVCVCE